jgi:hypothetical protein
MALTPDAIVDFAYVRATLTDLTHSDQDEVEKRINSISERCNRETKRNLVARAYAQRFDGEGQVKLVLPQWPVTGVTLNVDTSRVFGAATELVEDTDYFVDAAAGIIDYPAGFPRALRSIYVEWTGGIAAADLPRDLKDEVVQMVRIGYRRLDGDGLGVETMQNPGGTATQYEPDLPLSMRRVLAGLSREQL